VLVSFLSLLLLLIVLFGVVKLPYGALRIMALGSDVRDILELEGADEKDDFITKEALFSDPKKVLISVGCCSVRISIRPNLKLLLCMQLLMLNTDRSDNY